MQVVQCLGSFSGVFGSHGQFRLSHSVLDGHTFDGPHQFLFLSNPLSGRHLKTKFRVLSTLLSLVPLSAERTEVAGKPAQ